MIENDKVCKGVNPLGVSVERVKGKIRYRVRVRKNGKIYHVGRFDTQEEGVIARDNFLKKMDEETLSM